MAESQLLRTIRTQYGVLRLYRYENPQDFEDEIAKLLGRKPKKKKKAGFLKHSNVMVVLETPGGQTLRTTNFYFGQLLEMEKRSNEGLGFSGNSLHQKLASKLVRL